jgi:flagellar biosynthesis chaperone FliJ
MSISNMLRRLLSIRSLEEEQLRVKLETATAKLRSLEEAREAAIRLEAEGRSLLAESAVSGEVTDRIAGLLEITTGNARSRTLDVFIEAAKRESAERRREFLEKRMERQQAETLITEATAREELESKRRSQRIVDDWFGAHRHRVGEGREQD